MNNIYRIADKNIKISSLFPFIHVYCEEYETDGEADFEIGITEEDIRAERREVQTEITDDWLEISAVYRKIAEIIGTENFGVTDILGNFGLTSISSIRLAAKIYKKYGVQLKVRSLVSEGSIQKTHCKEFQ